MSYRNIAIMTPSLLNKVGDTSFKPRFKLQYGHDIQNVNDEQAIIVVRSTTSYLFDVKTVVTTGEFTLDFSNESLASLPKGEYEFQINVHENDTIEKYPENGYVSFEVTEDGKVQPSGLVPQITFDSVLEDINQQVDDKIKVYMATIAKGENGAPGDKGENGKDGTDGKDAKNLYLNVLDFGADKTGQTDATSAFKAALAKAETDAHFAIFVPAGTYLLSETLRIIDTQVIGESRHRTVLKSSALTAIELGTFSKLFELTLDMTQAADGAIGVRLGFYKQNSDGITTYDATHYSSLDHVIFNDDANHTKSVMVLLRSDYSQTPNAISGIWGNVFKDLFFFNVANGIVLDTRDYGWINGNKFSNILMVGFQTIGLSLQSSGDNPLGLQHNIFNGVEIEALSTTNNDAKAFNVTAGQFNFFDKCSVWDDTTGSVKFDSLYFGMSKGYPNYWEIESNNFVNAKLETDIAGDERVLALNKIDAYNVMNFERPLLYGDRLLTNNYNNVLKDNLLPVNLIDIYNRLPEATSIVASGTVGQGNDQQSSYVTLDKSSSFEQTIFGIPKDRLINKQFMTYTVVFSTSSLDGFSIEISIKDSSGTSVPINSVFTERIADGTYAYHAMADLSTLDLTNTNYFDVKTVFVAANTIKLRQIKLADQAVNHVASYAKEQLGQPLEVVTSDTIDEWSDLGIYLPTGHPLAFSTDLISTKQIGTKKNVQTPFIV